MMNKIAVGTFSNGLVPILVNPRCWLVGFMFRWVLIPRLFFLQSCFTIVLVSYRVNVSFAFGCMFYMTINLEISFGKVILKYFELSCFVICINWSMQSDSKFWFRWTPYFYWSCTPERCGSVDTGWFLFFNLILFRRWCIIDIFYCLIGSFVGWSSYTWMWGNMCVILLYIINSGMV